jgi:hypothetical protein
MAHNGAEEPRSISSAIERCLLQTPFPQSYQEALVQYQARPSSRRHRQRRAAAHVLANHRADQRRVGPPRWTPATWCTHRTPTDWSRSRRSSR